MEFGLIILITLIIIIIIAFLTKFKRSKPKTFEEKLYEMVGFTPYKSYKVEFRKTFKKPDGIYFQYNNGCVLYCLINIGYLNDKDIPSSMKYYKNHNYSQDKKTYEDVLKRILSLIDLAQLWINLGGDVPYKENGNPVLLEDMKKKVFDIIKKSIDNPERKYEDILPAFKLVGKNERFMTVIGKIPIKPIYLKDTEYKDKLDKLNLKSAIDKGFIKENEPVFCLNHFISYMGIIYENSVKYYLFHDSMTHVYKTNMWESMKDSKILFDEGIIYSPENSKLLNLEETNEKTVGILKPLFI